MKKWCLNDESYQLLSEKEKIEAIRKINDKFETSSLFKPL